MVKRLYRLKSKSSFGWICAPRYRIFQPNPSNRTENTKQNRPTSHHFHTHCASVPWDTKYEGVKKTPSPS